MKKIIVIVVLLFSSVGYTQNNCGEKKIYYSEYHPSEGFTRSEIETSKSMEDYIIFFQEKNKVEINGIYKVPFTYNSFAYFFTFEGLTEKQKNEFISGRVINYDLYNVNRIITMVSNVPFSLEKLLVSIDVDYYDCEKYILSIQ